MQFFAGDFLDSGRIASQIPDLTASRLFSITYFWFSITVLIVFLLHLAQTENPALPEEKAQHERNKNSDADHENDHKPPAPLFLSDLFVHW